MHHLHLAGNKASDSVDLSLLYANDLLDDSTLDPQLGLDLAFYECADVEATPCTPTTPLRRLGCSVA